MDYLLEAIKLIGGMLGIATAAFIVFDRVSRNKPIFALHAKPRVAGDNYLFLRVKNVLDEDVVIENWRIEPDGLVGLSTGVSVRALVGAMIRQIPTTILPPLGEEKFNLVILDLTTNRKRKPLTISAQWNTTRHPWPFRRRAKITTTVERLEELKGAHQTL
jgi:hypothetical protein